jgi:hypothetical protein
MRQLERTGSNVLLGTGKHIRSSGRNIEKFHAMQRDGFKATMDSKSVGGLNIATMDSVPALTDPSIGNLPQFLTNALTGVIRNLTAPRRSRDILGVTIAGDWEDEYILQRIETIIGQTQLYGDVADVTQASVNRGWMYREIVRFMGSVSVKRLEADRAAKNGFDDVGAKHAALARAFAITENKVSLFGWAGKRCFGFLNDPLLPAWSPVASTGTGASPLWSTKTYDLMQADITSSVQDLIDRSNGHFSGDEAFTWSIPKYLTKYLATRNTLGTISLKQWFAETYPMARTVVLPELDGAVSTLNGWIMHIEKTFAADDSTDSGYTIENIVQKQMFQLSTIPQKTGFSEYYSSAQTGVMVKRPWAFSRRSSM